MAYIKFVGTTKLLECTVSLETPTVVTLKFPKTVTVNDSGFDIFLDKKGTMNIGGSDYRSFKTIYRNDEETAKYNGYQLSCDGSTYEKPEPPEPIIKTKTVTVSAIWDDMGDELEIRLSSVFASVYVNGELLEIITLDEGNNWRKQYKNVPETDEYTIIPDEVEKYKRIIDGTTVTYHTNVPLPDFLSNEELADAITEMVELIEAQSEEIAIVQDAILELTERIEGGN